MTFSPNIALVLLRGESLAWCNHLHSPTAPCPLLSRAYSDSFFLPKCAFSNATRTSGMGKNPQNSTAWDLHAILTAAKSNWKAFCALLGKFPSS